MEKAFETELTGDDKAELKKLLEQFEEAMRRYDEQRIKDWEEIERLQADTRAKLEFLRKAA